MMKELIYHLIHNSRVLNNPLVKSAFEAVDRADFVPPAYQREAYEDYPLPIGYGQTISQPTTVAFMLELLDPRPCQKILDLGSGSGWTTTLLANIVGEKGRVYGVELVPELVEYGKKNLAKYGFKNAQIRQANQELGVPSEAPFDRILVSASADKLPQDLLRQLKDGGVMVIPIKDSIWRIEKLSREKLEKKEYKGFVFVPLIDRDTKLNSKNTPL